MSILFSCTTSISAGEFPELISCRWPLGRVTVTDDRFIFDLRVRKFELLFKDIDYIEFNFLQANFEYQQPGVPANISVNGWLAARQIKALIIQQKLPLTVR